jgi:hypothetical protein
MEGVRSSETSVNFYHNVRRQEANNSILQVTAVQISNLAIICLFNDDFSTVENLTGSPSICYASFRTINFPCFFPYSFPALHVIEWYVEAEI